MSTKVKFKKIVRIIVFAFCIFGLTHQTYDLVLQYRSGTIVNFLLTSFTFSRLPAIRICYPMLASMKKLTKFYLKNKAFQRPSL